MLCLVMLGSAILAFPVDSAVIQHNSWVEKDSSISTINALCWGPGIWPHPSHCRLFSLCYLDPDGNITSHLFLCSLDSSYSSRSRSCISGQVMPDCATSLEDDVMLNKIPAGQLSIDKPPEFNCSLADTPYCANSEILMICGPNEAFIGFVNCSKQYVSQEFARLRCDESKSICVASSKNKTDAAATPEGEVHLDNPIHTEEFETNTEISLVEAEEQLLITNVTTASSETDTTISPLFLVLPIASTNKEIILSPHGNTSQITNDVNIYEPTKPTSVLALKITIPNTSDEGEYMDDIYDGDDEYEVYEDREGILPNFPNVMCSQKGIQCADKTTIMDCEEDSIEPLIIMSCATLIHSDEGENAIGQCDDETSACIMSSEDMNLSFEIKAFSLTEVSQDFASRCESQSGLQCVDNETLVACSGQRNTTNYAITCGGTAESETGMFLQGHCYEGSCMIVVVNETISEIEYEESQPIQNDNYQNLLHCQTDINMSKSVCNETKETVHNMTTEENVDILFQEVYEEYVDDGTLTNNGYQHFALDSTQIHTSIPFYDEMKNDSHADFTNSATTVKIIDYTRVEDDLVTVYPQTHSSLSQEHILTSLSSPVSESKTATETNIPSSNTAIFNNSNTTPISHTKTIFMETITPVPKSPSLETDTPLTEIEEVMNTNDILRTPVFKQKYPTDEITALEIKTTPYKSIITEMMEKFQNKTRVESSGDSITESTFNLQAPASVPTTGQPTRALTPQTHLLPTGHTSNGAIPLIQDVEQQLTAGNILTTELNPIRFDSNWNDPPPHHHFKAYSCHKPGIQCMDNITLAACLPDLTVSYTVSCLTLLPHVMSENYAVLCSFELNMCTVAVRNSSTKVHII